MSSGQEIDGFGSFDSGRRQDKLAVADRLSAAPDRLCRLRYIIGLNLRMLLVGVWRLLLMLFAHLQ